MKDARRRSIAIKTTKTTPFWMVSGCGAAPAQKDKKERQRRTRRWGPEATSNREKDFSYRLF